MTERNSSATASTQLASYAKPMLIGAGIGLVLISFFVFGVDEPHPSWPSNWMVKPLILTPLIAAMGGAFFAFMGRMRSQGGWIMALGYVVSVVGFIIALWMGLVLGLNGTMWN